MSAAKTYVKRSVAIEAVQYTIGAARAIKNFVGNENLRRDGAGTVFIQTLEGEMKVSLGDYVIKGVKGECYPCKPDIFELTYSEPSLTNLDIGQAIAAIKQGSMLTRKAWNGTGQYVFLIKGTELQSTLKLKDSEYVGKPTINSVLAFKTSHNNVQLGWNPSQVDVMANDWEVVE